MADTRTLNMEKRRERTLEQARKMLADGGFDALNLRDLAEVSGITVPTIYNLIGNKAEILKALVMGTFAKFEKSLASRLPCPTEQLPQLMMNTLADMIGSDEDSYRATALATERLEMESEEGSDYGYRRAPLRKFARKMLLDARAEGLLKGDIDSDLLVEQVIGIHQIAFRDWAHRAISLDDLKNQSLRGFYIALSADAVPEFRAQLIAQLNKL